MPVYRCYRVVLDVKAALLAADGVLTKTAVTTRAMVSTGQERRGETAR